MTITYMLLTFLRALASSTESVPLVSTWNPYWRNGDDGHCCHCHDHGGGREELLLFSEWAFFLVANEKKWPVRVCYLLRYPNLCVQRGANNGQAGRT